uniref:DISP complex protein LRCH3-like n=1 Tax=Pristiophorus japonicus TaxID=55135 RepID=UPI00398F1F78
MGPGDEPPPAASLSLSRSLDKALEEAAASGILNLSNRKLRDFPRAASKHDLSDLTQADLSKNRLSEVPCELCQYISLETLNLYHNCVRNIPSAITNLQALTYLNISRSQLCVLPAYLCCLPLKVLIASNNKLTSLPDDIGNLRQLRELDVSCNEIQRLPPQIGLLESLRDLNVRRNQLLTLPEELSELPLVRLDFSCNKVTRIPVCYRHLRHLQNILLDNNPLQSPPAQICTKGKIHIFKYLNIEACKIVPDLTDLERAIRPQGFSSCLSDDFSSRQHSGLDSGFNSVDSGNKRWSGNESTDEFTDLSLRMVEISREQRQLRESRPSGHTENNGAADQDLEQIDFIDSSVNGEEEEPQGHRPLHSQEDNKRSRNSTEKSDRLPHNGMSPGKDETPRDSEERRRPETLQIWQEREKQLRIQTAERRERGISISSTTKPAAFSLQSQNSLSDLNSKPGPGGYSGNSTSSQSLHSKSEGRLPNVSGGMATTALRPDHTPPSASSTAPTSPKESGSTHRPSSFLFRSSTRSNLKSSTVLSPGSPQSPPYTFPEAPTDSRPAERQRSVEQRGEPELTAQLRKNIESRLNRVLPEDLGEALTNGVTLCQLVNHIRPRSISIIHIPSPAVESLCQSRHVLEEDGLQRVARMVQCLEQVAQPKPVRLSAQD